MPGPQIQNPTGAFGNPVISGFDQSKPSNACTMRAAVTTINAGDLVAYSSSAGYVIRCLTNTAVNLIAGVALENAESTAGTAINVAIEGYCLVNKGTAAITAGNYITCDTTTTGSCANVTAATAITQAKDIAGWAGVCMVSATAGDATVAVWLGGTVG